MNTPENAAVLRDSDMAMRASVVLEALTLNKRIYKRGSISLGADVAMQSAPLVESLLKIGLFAVNIQSMVTLAGKTEDGKAPFTNIPSFLLGMAAHYATDVAPQASGSDGAVVDIDHLVKEVSKIEKAMGNIPVDRRLVEDVTSLAYAKLRENSLSHSGLSEGV